MRIQIPVLTLFSSLLFLFLLGCVFEPVNPAAPQSVPIEESKAETQAPADDAPVEEANVSEPVAEQKEPELAPEPLNTINQTELTNQTNESSSQSAPVPNLSPREQVEMTPLVEKAVMDSPCYQLTWEGIEAAKQERPISVDKDMTSQYRSGKRFTVWVHYFLKQSRSILDRKSITVNVDDLKVTCNTTNFTIDWQRALTTNN